MLKIYASKVVKLAQSWVGKMESNGTHKEIIDIYNTYLPHPRNYKMTYKDPWCATMVSALFIKLGYAEQINIIECSCTRMIEKAKALGIWVEADDHVPHLADFIIYDWDDDGKGDNTKKPDHIGVVVEVNGTKFKVIEGNYNNAVGYRELEIDGKCIRGFVCPHYDEEVKEEKEEVLPTLKYQVGQTVTINGVYTSSNSTKKLKPARTSGKITSILQNAKNPYLLEDGYIGWVNNDVIIGLASDEIEVGDKVQVTKKVDWYGTSLAVSGTYDVIEVSGDRVVIGKGKAVTCAIHKNNLKLV